MPDYYEQDKEIIELFITGKSQTEIAKKLGLTRERIRQRLLRNGFKGRNFRWIPNRENLLEALSNATSFAHAAQLLGLTDLQLNTTIKHHSASKYLEEVKTGWKSQKRDKYYLSRQRPFIIQLRALALKVGHTPRQEELQANGIAPMTLLRTFGSIKDAMLAAGLVPNSFRKTSPLPPDFNEISEPTSDYKTAQRRANLLRQIFGDLPEPKGNEHPQRNTATSTSYYRDPKVAGWVLQHANGICEICGTQGYETDTGISFLETHHVVPLSDGGPDTIWNLIGACEICHGKLHRWKYREDMRNNLYASIARLRQVQIEEKEPDTENI